MGINDGAAEINLFIVFRFLFANDRSSQMLQCCFTIYLTPAVESTSINYTLRNSSIWISFASFLLKIVHVIYLYLWLMKNAFNMILSFTYSPALLSSKFQHTSFSYCACSKRVSLSEWAWIENPPFGCSNSVHTPPPDQFCLFHCRFDCEPDESSHFNFLLNLHGSRFPGRVSQSLSVCVEVQCPSTSFQEIPQRSQKSFEKCVLDK